MASKRRNMFYQNKEAGDDGNRDETTQSETTGFINEHYRHLMLIFLKKGKKAAETCGKICAVYGEDAVTERVCHKWFSRFRSGNFSVQDAPRSGRPTEINSDEEREMVDTNSRYTTRQIADILKITKSSVENHLHQVGYVSRLDVWVMITGDEKWIIYQNMVERKRSWGKRGDLPQSIPKAGLHPKKVTPSIWWDWRADVFHELLPTNRTINLDMYCDLLDKLNKGLFFTMAMPDRTLLGRRGRSYWSLAGQFCPTLHIHPTLHLQFSTCFGLSKIR
ncbi:hypothetical protein AAG570_012264 [Ranatra chinensis]|uniref:Mos1 transposase HTH domain-containing protein n=1 Tax=Ranatra chinensis TaxID=642074 RepID=A0ABD0YI99_9HEMI